ncbi:glucosamine-6-phosphate deaminase [Streptococcus caprae]|uniref:Glucosamine-6-phosphate deaminase n=1 Tax=Streptococcus caprae TaxID=1640501 RepID=A0ABV8CUX5_9STRE
MKIFTVKTPGEGAKIALDILTEKVAAGAKTLGLATGSSPVEFYQAIVASDLDFSEMTSVNLDEYAGIDADNPQSYRYFMNQHLFQYKPFKASYFPDGEGLDENGNLWGYEKIIDENPVDVQILGIGRNGHIGFNEPGTPFDSVTHLVDLAEDTIEANARFFASIDEVPRQAYSMGISSILKAKTIILFAYGEAKADAIAKTVHGPVTNEVTSTSLQNHPEVYIIADEAATSLL